MASWITAALAAAMLLAGSASAQSRADAMERGFRHMYNLDFPAAHLDFDDWERQHPGSPMAPVGHAAGVLFAEFHRLGTLQAELFADDDAFDRRRKLDPDENARKSFEAHATLAGQRAEQRLAGNPFDKEALFALTLVHGLRADYAALLDKSNFAALRHTRRANAYAARLIAIDPDFVDAYFATGISQYLVGSMAAPVRWLARLGGVPGDSQRGIEHMKKVADHGRLLAPFARLMLAVAHLRQKDRATAGTLLAALAAEFPRNPLYARELQRISSGGSQ
jgi:hypothetical protein